jgi:MerR family transcriptional regulator, light-induced transcriptional regulator
VRPARRPGGQRLFSEDDVSRLTLLREAVDAGQSISSIARLPTVALRALIRFDRQVGNDFDCPIEHLLRLVDAYDFIRLRSSLVTIGANRSVAEFFDDIVAPLIEEIEYSAGDPHVRATKLTLLTEGLHSVSARFFERFTPARTAPSFIMSTFPGEAQAAAPLLAAIVAAECGFRAAFLGQLTPVELQSLTIASGPAVLGVYMGSANADYARMLEDLRVRLASVPVVACGAGAAFGGQQQPIRSMRELSETLLRLE